MTLPAALRSLRVRNYRLYAGGQLVSLTGRWGMVTAQDWLVTQLGGGGVALGTTTALQFGPSLVLTLWAGVLADRADKRRLLLVTQSLAGLVALALGLAVVTHVVTLGWIYALALVLGAVNAVDTPARQAFAVEMVGPADVTNAVALNSVTFNSARIVGPSLAGLLIAAVGTGPVFLLTAASTAGVLAGLLAMRPAELFPSPRLARAPGQLREGLRYVAGRRDLLLVVALVGVVSTAGLNFPVTLALMARQVFAGGAETYGLLSSSLAVGSLAGALLAARRGRPRQRTLLLAATAFGVAEAAAGLMPTVPTFAVALAVTGFCVLTFVTTANASVQLGAGEQLRGRVMGIYLLVFLGTTPLGGELVGLLCEHAGARAGLVAGGLVSAAGAVVAGLLLLRAQRGPALDPVRAALHLPVRGGWAPRHPAP